MKGKCKTLKIYDYSFTNIDLVSICGLLETRAIQTVFSIFLAAPKT